MTKPLTRRRFLTGTAALAATIAHRRQLMAAAPTDSPYLLHFAQPASKWPDALPVGNGRLGAMVFGNPSMERIQLNEESIWDGQPGLNRNNPLAGAAVPRIRELLFAGKVAEAEALATSDLLAVPRRMPCYQTLGDLHLDFSPMGLAPETKVEDYVLKLDLDTAIVTTSFTHAGTRYTREVFSSAPDQVIVVRLTASAPGKLSFRATLDRPGPTPFKVSSAPPASLTLEGQALPVNDNPGLKAKEPQTGVRFHARMLGLVDPVSQPNGIVANPTSKQLIVTNATTVTLLIDCATSYRFPSDSTSPMRLVEGNSAAMRGAVTRNLTKASRRTYQDLRARHIAEHQRLFRRTSFTLGPDASLETPTDARVQRIKDGGEDPNLYPIYLQFGRYMLLCSSRPGTLASNLQGIWNDSVDPPWGSKYTVNINAQMNYWLAERANLADCHAPLFDLLEKTRAAGTLTAKSYYGARGTVVHHNTDIWGDSAPIDGLGGGIWAMGSAWLSLHLWDHFDFSGDLTFLRTRAYPTLRENVVFLLDYLTPAPTGTPYAGLLVTGPSCSPENKYRLPGGKAFNLCMGPTMDLAITRAVLTRFISAAALLPSADAPLVTRAKAALAKLPPYRITHEGRLQEWPEDFADDEPGHRHISHLFGLFPEDQITLTSTPELAHAARTTLDKRLAAGSGSTGWSRSWIVNCMARLGDGDAAWHNLLELFRQCTRHNLFDVCGLKENSPFQIDGNLGAPTGILEMLLQSHETDASTGNRIVRILPALPEAWPEGNFRGVRARGGMEVDLTWQAGRPVRAVLRASLARTILFSAPSGTRITAIREGGRLLQHDRTKNNAAPLTVSAGKTYTITFA
jgi:alpha-L-fucosidase 2